MGKKLAYTVVVDGVVYEAGTELPDGVTVENEAAFEEDAAALPTPLEQIEADQEAADKRREEEEAAAAEEAAKAEEAAPARRAATGRASAAKG